MLGLYVLFQLILKYSKARCVLTAGIGTANLPRQVYSVEDLNQRPWFQH
jgi:hypothetical protein